MRTIGATLTALEPGYCAIELVPGPAVSQQHGYVHAGVVAAIVDSAGGYAGFTLFPADASVLTVEFKLNLVAPAQGERLVAEGFVVKSGRTLTITRGEVHGIERGQAHAGRADAADADDDARQAGRASGLRSQSIAATTGGSRTHGQHSHDRLRSRRGDRDAARQRARVRAGGDRAARSGHRPRERVPAGPVAQDGRPRPPRHHRRGGVRRRGARLRRARRRDGGDLARVRLGRPVLRRAFEPVRQPDPAQRQRGAEAASTCRSSSAASTSGRSR